MNKLFLQMIFKNWAKIPREKKRTYMNRKFKEEIQITNEI